jgi:adenylate kinase
MIIALTGTPGTGKTTISEQLKKNYNVVYLNALIKERRLYTGVDYQRDCLIADLKQLQEHLCSLLKNRLGVTIIEGHLSHLLENLDAVIVLRCHPQVLKQRLSARGYTDAKIRENLVAEALDIILCEAVERHERVYEVNTTSNTPQQTLQQVIEIIKNLQHNKQIPQKYRPGSIDWIEEAQHLL